MLRTKSQQLLQRRWKSKKVRWNIAERKKTTCDKALENFDDFYGSVFGIRWKNMRAALLTEHKYIALVNNFGDTEKTCSQLELDGAINIKSLVQLAKERMEKEDEEGTLQLPGKAGFKIGERLLDITKRQQEREKSALYPESSAEPVEYEEQQSPDYTVDAKKSLEQAIEEDTYIDNKRMVDPESSTGGLYEYLPANKIKGMEDWIPESDHYKYYQTDQSDFPLNMEMEQDFQFPENLCIYSYEMSNCSTFRSPKKCLTGVLSHYLMDGASILPPLLLDVRHGERVLDACSAPGGKALLLLQTLHPGKLLCNDIQESRVSRIRKVMQEYLFDFEERWEGKSVHFNQSDARHLDMYDAFDKILVDVPCTTDRHSLMQNDNNIFKSTRIKERLRLPELQAGILENCLRLLKPGGSLVYSTCSLSPVQNDGVVHMALQRAFNEHNITVTIKDLSLVIQLFNDVFKFEHPKGLKYGQLVIPFLPANFGPMYFCKIRRDT